MKKTDIFSIRVDSNDRLRMEELARVSGVPVSSIVKFGISRLLSEVYDTDGNLLSPLSVGAARRIDAKDGYFEIGVICRTLGISRDAMRKMVVRRAVPSIRLGKKLYVSYKIIELYGKDKHDARG